MKFSHVLRLWHDWFHTPVSSLNISLLRIVFGFLFLTNLTLLLPDRYMWFTSDGIWPTASAIRELGTARLDVLRLWVSSPTHVDLFICVGFLAGFAVLLGFQTRISLVVCWVILVSLSHRVSVMIHSGDTLLRIINFFLIFSPCHRRLSLDALLQKSPKSALANPFSQRILQLQLCLIYFVTAYWKLKGQAWHDGTAVGTVLNLTEFHRFPIPEIMRGITFSKAATGLTIFLEGLFPILIWFKDTRKVMLITGVFLHVGLEYTLNIQLFQPIILSLYLLFIDHRLLESLVQKIQTALAPYFRKSSETAMQVTVHPKL